MKIAYIGGKGLPSKSGVERVVEAITTRLASKHEIYVYCDSTCTASDAHIEGIHLIRVPTIKGKYFRATSQYLFSALHALFKSDYDIIHVHGIETGFVLPLLRSKYRVIGTSHGVPSRTPLKKWGKIGLYLMSLCEYPFLFLSNYATSVSSVDAEYMNSKYKRPVIYIPNGVDAMMHVDQKSALDTLGTLGMTPQSYILFVAGRIDPLKGCHLILEALDRHNIDIPFLIVGDLSQVPTYGESLRQMALNKRVFFLPLIQNKELLSGIVRTCKFFIFPSVREAMSMMLLEAASLGAPIICSDIPENKIVMQDNAVYFHSEDAIDLAKQIQWALGHADEMSQLGRKASLYVRDTLTWEKIVEQYEEMYAVCTNGRKMRNTSKDNSRVKNENT